MTILEDIFILKVKTTPRIVFHSEGSKEEVEKQEQGQLIRQLYRAGCIIETVQQEYEKLNRERPEIFGSQSVSGYESRLPRGTYKVNREATLAHLRGERTQ